MEDYAIVPTNEQDVNSDVQDANNYVQDVNSGVQDVNSGVQDANNYVQDVKYANNNIRFGNNNKSKNMCRFNPAPPMYGVFHTIISIFAIYLSFKCNNGVNIGELLVAILCPVLYVLYKVAVSPDLCGIRR